jgi:hypothetical protein
MILGYVTQKSLVVYRAVLGVDGIEFCGNDRIKLSRKTRIGFTFVDYFKHNLTQRQLQQIKGIILYETI